MRIVATVIVLLGALAGTAAAEEPVFGSLPSVFRYPHARRPNSGR